MYTNKQTKNKLLKCPFKDIWLNVLTLRQSESALVMFISRRFTLKLISLRHIVHDIRPWKPIISNPI